MKRTTLLIGLLFAGALHAQDFVFRGAEAVDAPDFGDGLSSTPNPYAGVWNSCLELKQTHPDAPTGNYTIRAAGSELLLTCDMETDGGGWTVLFTYANGIERLRQLGDTSTIEATHEVNLTNGYGDGSPYGHYWGNAYSSGATWDYPQFALVMSDLPQFSESRITMTGTYTPDGGLGKMVIENSAGEMLVGFIDSNGDSNKGQLLRINGTLIFSGRRQVYHEEFLFTSGSQPDNFLSIGMTRFQNYTHSPRFIEKLMIR